MHLPPESIRTLKITEPALVKLQRYARLTARALGRPYECMGFLAARPGSSIVEHVVLAPGQTASLASVTTSPAGVLAAARELDRLGLCAIGFWHSHGTAAPTHSPSATDRLSSLQILGEVAPGHRVVLEQELDAAAGGEGVLRFHDGHATVELVAGSEAAAALLGAGLRVRRRVEVGVAFSLIVSALEEPAYAEVYTTCCPTCGVDQVRPHPVPVEVLREPTDDELVDEIRAKVRPQMAYGSAVWRPADRTTGHDGAVRGWLRLPRPASGGAGDFGLAPGKDPR